MRRLLGCLVLACVLWAGAPRAEKNGTYRHGHYSQDSTRPGRERAVWRKSATASGNRYERLGTRQGADSKVVRMAPRRAK